MKDHIVIWEPPPLDKPEFRLYYDGSGKVICYACEPRPEGGDYIVIDAATFAEGRPDIFVIDGEITKATLKQVVSKLMPTTDENGFNCAADDITVLVTDEEAVKWKMIVYEL